MVPVEERGGDEARGTTRRACCDSRAVEDEHVRGWCEGVGNGTADDSRPDYDHVVLVVHTPPTPQATISGAMVFDR